MTQDFLQGFFQKRFENRAASRASIVFFWVALLIPLSALRKDSVRSLQGLKAWPPEISESSQHPFMATNQGTAEILRRQPPGGVALVLQETGAALAGM